MNSNNEEFQEALALSQEMSWRSFGKRVWFYAPSFIHYENSEFCPSSAAFPAISVTGTSCALGCKHCQGNILESMIPATTPEDLIAVCEDIRGKGGVGCLISGGCLPDGSVPLERFTEAIARIKREFGLTVVVHTGIVNEHVARGLKKAGVEAALIDVIGSDETIQDVYQLKAKVKDYDKSLKILHDSKIPIVPHVLVGLHYGEIKGEIQALKMISKYNPAAVIIIALMPIKETPMENVNPPSPEAIVRVITAARFMFPTTPLVLGCARPLGEHRIKTDILSLKAGINAIVFPTEEAIQLAKSIGLKATYLPICCSQIYENVKQQAPIG